MATPGFGFSFGDLVQAVQLIHKVCKALRESGGATEESKLVFIELEYLEILLQQLICGSWDDGTDAGHLNAVKGLALTCKLHLADFLSKIELFKQLGGDRQVCMRSKLGIGSAKVRWAIQMQNEVEKFRTLIMAKMVSINLLLQTNVMSAICAIELRTRAQDTEIANLQAQTNRLVKVCVGMKVDFQDFRGQASVQHADVRELLDKIIERKDRETSVISRASKSVIERTTQIESALGLLIQTFGTFTDTALSMLRQIINTDTEIYALLLQIQKGIGSRPLFTTNECISFTDALGRTHQLPYQYFKYWEVMEPIIQREFKGLPGEQRVLAGQYHVLNSKRKGFIIDRNRWERSVFPGSEVNMSMIITTRVIQDGVCLCSRAGCCEDFSLSESTKAALTSSRPLFEAPCLKSTRHEVDFVFDLSEAEILEKIRALRQAGATECIPLSDLMSLSSANRAKSILNEIDAFKSVHLSFGRGPGAPRTGYLNDGHISVADFCEQAFLASRWSLSAVIGFLAENDFPPLYLALCSELGICGHGFLRLQNDTEALRWRLICEFESGNRLLRENNEQSLADFCERLDEDLVRLSTLVREAVGLSKGKVEAAFVRNGGYISESTLRLLRV